MFELRIIALADLDLICRHRYEMFREMGSAAGDLAAMATPFRRWLSDRLSDGTYFGFVSEEGTQAVGAVGLMELNWPPHPVHPEDDRRGYVLNVFVEPEYRGRGIARSLMAAADLELRRRGLRYATLHASPMGRHLYGRIGWNATTEMGKVLTPTLLKPG